MNKTATTVAAGEIRKKYRKRSQGKEIMMRLVKNKGAIIGFVFLLILAGLALFANVIYDYEVDVIGQNMKERFIHPCWEHPFGTDHLGRDLLARIIYGARSSLPVGFIAVAVSLCFGMILGACAGFFGGKVEDIIMRCMDILAAVPNILMAIVLVAAMGTSTFSLCFALGVASTPSFARITRAAVLSVGSQEFVESARAIGCTSGEIILEHIIPNCLSPILVQASLRIGGAIISASGLSYLGLGVPPPVPEWGSLLSGGRSYMRDHSYLTMIPGLVIMFTVIAFNQLGDGLRDAMDPKLKK